MQQVDSSQNITDYDEGTQASIRKIMFDQKQKVRTIRTHIRYGWMGGYGYAVVLLLLVVVVVVVFTELFTIGQQTIVFKLFSMLLLFCSTTVLIDWLTDLCHCLCTCPWSSC
jgi:hypothetical protein